jgi:hypothetical protein
MRNVEERHETRLKSMNSTIDNVKALMIIQEDYICWLEKQVETLSGMRMGDYFKEHPRD